jgi:small-conductance mechanosensitive channel
VDHLIVKDLIAQGMDVGIKVLGAIVVWIVGSWLIRFTNNLLSRSLTDKKVDETLVKYSVSALNILLKLILIVAIFSYFGVQTTTIAGLLAGVGLAIGTMWGGMMSNLAAGAFLVFLKPFKLGDFISAGDVTGTVTEIGLFSTTINTPDNVRTFVGNNKIFAGNIQNFTANPTAASTSRCGCTMAWTPPRPSNCCRSGWRRFPMSWPILPRWWRSWSSPWGTRCWRCALTSTTTTIGRCILTRTA